MKMVTSVFRGNSSFIVVYKPFFSRIQRRSQMSLLEGYTLNVTGLIVAWTALLRLSFSRKLILRQTHFLCDASICFITMCDHKRNFQDSFLWSSIYLILSFFGFGECQFRAVQNAMKSQVKA